MAQSKEAFIELSKIAQLSASISSNFTLERIMDAVYREFRGVIPYDRIGLALIEDGGQTVRASWARSDMPAIHLASGFRAALPGSSLAEVVELNRPRVINDLSVYYSENPDSASTALILKEGLLSSLTCPLIASTGRIGFLFFTSREANTYAGVHAELFQSIAANVALAVEKGRLMSELLQEKMEIARQNEELRRLNELKNGFLGMAAHDLRGSVSTMKAVSELLLGELDIPAADRLSLLQTAYRQSVHMLALIDGLLDVNRIEAGKLILGLEYVEVREVLEEVVADQRRIASAKRIELLLCPAPAGTVHADAVRLRQIFNNLISNAIKYSPSGSCVCIRADLEGDDWRFSISDRGPGLSSTDKQLLFRDYETLSAKPTAGENSFGLGLAITSRLVRAHGGRIGVESSPGQGSNFWFTLGAGRGNIEADQRGSGGLE